MKGPVGQGLHLARRFFGSLSRADPDPADTAWVQGVLLPGERGLWARMSAPDRRHAVGVARAVEAEMGSGASRAVLAAALLHDVGKVDAGLGTFARVLATVVGRRAVRGRSAVLAEHGGPVGRLGRYLRHPEIGGTLLQAAGSDSLTRAWAESHHRPEERWDPAVPVETGRVLKAADDD
ncbi:MAG: HD domain-containing protein [Acidimicrobiales bacterium]